MDGEHGHRLGSIHGAAAPEPDDAIVVARTQEGQARLDRSDCRAKNNIGVQPCANLGTVEAAHQLLELS